MSERRFLPSVLRGALVAGAILAPVVSGCGGPAPAELHGTLVEPPLAEKPFRLASAAGPVTLDDLKGRLAVLAFGYTSCPLVCPTTMGRLAGALELLGPAADEVRVVLVTVDPELDTPERLARYLASFDARMIGLAGTPEEIAAVAAAYGIFHEIPETDEDRADLGHTAHVLVLDRRGRTRLVWSYGVAAEAMAADLAALLAER